MPTSTGNPLQIYEASLQMRRSYEHAALYALCMILPVVFLNFGSFSATLLAICPLAMGMLQMFGLMGILDIPLNSANMIGLSLMLGMGMENGVLITQDYLGQRGRYRMSPSTSVAVVLNTHHHHGRLCRADHCRPPRPAKSGPGVDHRHVLVAGSARLIILPTLLVWLTRNRQPARSPVKPPRRPLMNPSVEETLASGGVRRRRPVRPRRYTRGGFPCAPRPESCPPAGARYQLTICRHSVRR